MNIASSIVAVNDRIYNHPALRVRRKELRQQSTAAERLLWNALRGKRVGGWKFRRQFSVGPYILDFYCPKAKLNIELDGSQHYSEQGKFNDAIRDAYLNGLRIKVLRFENGLVMNQLDVVLGIIRSNLPLTPSLAKEGVQLRCGNVNVDNGEDGTCEKNVVNGEVGT